MAVEDIEAEEAHLGLGNRQSLPVAVMTMKEVDGTRQRAGACAAGQ